MTLPEWMLERLEVHRKKYSPVWQGFLSDHLPMASMALLHRNTPRPEVERWMSKYQEQLEPALNSIAVRNWREGIGELGAYRSLLDFYDAELSARGEEYVLRTYLPELISGWVSDAFHPLIRLGYARRFGCQSEVSAALAYLTVKGPDSRLGAVADSASPGENTWPPPSQLEGRTFDERLQSLLAKGNLDVFVPDNAIHGYAQDVLAIFNSSHNFFALHLVTATHAFLLATEGVEGIGLEMLAAGLVAGYVVAGAPALDSGTEATPIDVDFEHHMKFAFALEELGEILDDPSYRSAAELVNRNLPGVDVGIREIEQALEHRNRAGGRA